MNYISIITILKLNNFNNLKIIYNIIINQTYKFINQWIIIYDNKIININIIKEILNNIEYIDTYNNSILDSIKYININFDEKIINYEELLLNNNNIINNNIFIFMNLNYYYTNNFIEQCVYNFNNTNISHIYIDNIIFYDLILNNTFKISNYNKLIGFKIIYKIKNCLIIKNDNLIIKLLNKNNNNKREKCVLRLITYINNYEQISNDNLINNYYLSLYNNNDNDNLSYDIIYMSGNNSIVWDPQDMSLGGSEQAIVNLSENWIKLGKTVIVYGNFKKELTYNGVKYDFWYNFPFNKKINILIIWRTYGINLLMNFNLNANKIIIDFHDNFSYTLSHLNQELMFNLFNQVHKFNFKSLYHKNCFEQYVITSNYQITNNKYNIIMNGLRIDNFKINNNYIRNPYRFCYCSCYTRGLEVILEKIWPIIYNKEPKAELHIYYGMNYIFDDKYKLKMNILMAQCGVMDHGRQSMDMIIREKYLSTFHIYFNTSIAEIDCISIRESLITGCIPIISNFGVFKERHGLQYDFEITDKNCNNIANDIINNMYNFNFINESRKKLENSNTIISWYEIAKEWIDKSFDN
jgi:hypothetical protein